MKILFWISLSVVLYTYAGYPVVMAVWAKVRPKRWHRQPWCTGGHAPISIILAVCNGGRQLERQIERLLALDPAQIHEVIIVSDGSTDGTSELLERCQPARIKPIVLPQRAGKSAALNQGILAASGEILLFVDVRPTIQPGALNSLLANFADPSVGCVTGELLLGREGQDGTASAVSGLYWRYEQWIRNCEAAVDSPVGVYGGFYAIRRTLATVAPEGLILDDMFQPLEIIRQGYRSVIDPSAHVVDSWPQQASGEFRRKVRTLAGNFQLLGCSPWLLTFRNRLLFQLVSHKLLRLVVPWLFALQLVLAVVLGLHSAGFTLLATLESVLLVFAAIALKWRIPLLARFAAPLSALLLLNAAAVAGLYTFLFTRAPLWTIWQPTQVPGGSFVPADSATANHPSASV